jgi:hypothetical protein
VPHGCLSLPADGRRRASGALVSFALHATVIGWIFWGGTQLVQAANQRPGGEGPRGGGGGGGASRVIFFELPDVAPPQEVAMTVPTPEELVVSFKPPTAELPDIEIEMPKFEVPRAEVRATDFGSVLGRGAGTGGGAGAGTGRGGGIGSGQGTGIGDSIGPGTGGDGGHIFPPVPRQVILQPMGAPGSVKGKEVVVTFWVNTTGRVTRIETKPSLPRGSYSRTFRERMMSYLFTPALTLEGQPIAATFDITLIL